MKPSDAGRALLPEVWASHNRWRGDKLALIVGQERLSFAQLNSRINRIANGLLALGLAQGDKVAVLSENRLEMLEVLLGTMRAGLVAVPISSLLSGEALAAALTDCEAVALFVTSPLYARVQGHLPALANLRLDGRFSIGFEAPGLRPFCAWYEACPDCAPAVAYAPEDATVILYSSGTTGVPKGIVHTLRSRHHMAYVMALGLHLDERSVVLATTALYANGTWLMLMPALFMGATLIVMERFEPALFTHHLRHESVTHTFLVPAQLAALVAAPQPRRAGAGCLRALLSAGAPLREDLKAAVRRRHGDVLYELYGCTEGVATLITPIEMADRLSSVGLPLLGTDLAIVDEQGSELPRGTVGEIAGSGAALMSGYYKRPQATAAATWRDAQGYTWFRTGDIGRMDDRGYLYVLDRKTDMIISGGLNVFPGDIEQVFANHPAVDDVAVIGVPHERWGETPLALVIRKEPAAITAEELACWANARLSKHQRVAVEFHASFPRNALGKVLKRELRKAYWPDRASP